MNTLVQQLEQDQLDRMAKALPPISVGDLVKVGVLIREGDKERVQPYEGTVISQHKAGLNSTITVRKTFQGIGVERVFFVHSPRIPFIECLRSSKVRRAKLYYLRGRVGKKARLQERIKK